MINSDTIGKTVSFETYAQYVLGESFERVKVLGILDVESAKFVGDVMSLATAIYPTLPEGTPKDYRNYRYVKVRMPNGNDRVVALEWIRSETVVIHTDITAQFTVSNINADDVDEIIKVLNAYRYFNIQTKIL